MNEDKAEFLLLSSSKYAHINLPAKRGENMMMVMGAYSAIFHIAWQYTNVYVIPQDD